MKEVTKRQFGTKKCQRQKIKKKGNWMDWLDATSERGQQGQRSEPGQRTVGLTKSDLLYKTKLKSNAGKQETCDIIEDNL